MGFTHALSTNNYGPSKFVVATSAANGTHTTLASAMSDASAGDTIFIRDSVTENVTITPGVNIASYYGSADDSPAITGTLTMTGAGTSFLSGLRLITNSAPVITVSGSAASVLYIDRCYLDISNNTAITYSSSSGSSYLHFNNCTGDITTTGISLIDQSSNGFCEFRNSKIFNSGGSTTASTVSQSTSGGVVFRYCTITVPFTTSNKGNFQGFYCYFQMTSNTTFLTTAGTASTNQLHWSNITCGSAVCFSVGSGTTLELVNNRIFSTNTNYATGAGTLLLASNLLSTSLANTITVNTAETSDLSRYIATLQPAFFAYPSSTITNVTGDGTSYTIIWNAELYDVGSNFNTATGTFTAPIAGKYLFNCTCNTQGMSAGTTSYVLAIVTSGGNTYRLGTLVFTAGTFIQYTASGSVEISLAASETVTTTIAVSGGTLTADVAGLTGAIYQSHFSGRLIG